jgi:predicted anti-sigma-YlaC factor YlaD
MRELDCDEFVELVTAYLDGALDETTVTRFVDHVAVCDGCERYLDQFRQTIHSLGEQPAEQGGLPDGTRAAVLAAFRERKA